MRNFSETLRVSGKTKAITCVLLVFLADFLFFKQPIGWTAGLFSFALLMSFFVNSSELFLKKEIRIIAFLLVGQSFAMMVDVNWISYCLVFIGFVALVFMKKPNLQNKIKNFLSFIFYYMFLHWLSFFQDSNLLLRYFSKKSKLRNLCFNWVIPILLSSVFMVLFSIANPLIKSWFSEIDFNSIFNQDTVLRIIFWLAIAIASWPIIRSRQVLKFIEIKPLENNVIYNNKLLNRNVVSRALLLFNFVFFTQISTDLIYLWGDVELPVGLSYAQYAHEGAYTLVITALLAAFFVITILHKGGENENSKNIRVLLYFWVGQNILLVISSMLRLMLYVEFYQLTYLRVSAFIWMFLVLFGLVAIIFRIYLHRDNDWLLKNNLFALIAVLYICSFINFSEIIASYNIKNSYEISGSGKKLDMYYIRCEMDDGVIPALFAKEDYSKKFESYDYSYACRDYYSRYFDNKNWREWTFRQYRFKKILEKVGR